jgi:7,8-dihydro-6-hydroxymethylpterin-pyrophosphokinase
VANNFIAVDQRTRLGGNAMAGAQNLRWAQDVLQALKIAMDNMITGTDYSVVATQFGVDPLKAQTFYNLVAGTITDLTTSTNIPQLLAWLATCRS